MAIEISFPRGGRKPPPDAKPKDFEQDHDLFGRKRKKDNKSVQKGNTIQPNEEASDAVEVTYVESLTSKTVQDGMILIGCIREIKKVAMDISLPGRLYGKVLVNNISKPYTKLLQNVVDQNETENYMPLSELFTLGQCVAVKVLSLNDEKLGITLTLMPQQINANLSHSSVKTGMILWGAISEVEDHGYVVDLGINNCRAFLKKENCDAKKEYVVGELLWFAVSKADISPTATTIMLSTKQNIIKNMKIRDEISLDHLISGMQVDFTITKILKNGLEGIFLKKFTGYIEIGLSNNISNAKKFCVDKVIQARILYMVPVTKIAYLTIKTLDIHTRDKLENGALVHGKVLGISPIGVYLKLKDTAKRGFVPLKHAQKHKSQDKFIDFMYLKRNYRKNTAHECRILSYDYFEQMYICSTEYGLTKEGIIYTLDDLNNGQTVSAEIREIVPNGLLVNIQHVNGFIKNEHICDTVLKNYNKIKSRLKVGQKIQVRVWVVNSSKKIFYLTMRPSLVNTNLILKSYEEAEKGQQYLGVVRQITTNGLLVQFFGDVHGWVPKKELHFDATHRLDMLFKVGQLVKCTVVDRKKTKLTLSLQTSVEISEDTEIELKLGEHVTGIVTHITNEGIHVNVKDTDISAFIPTLYLSKFTKMAPILQKMYKTGDEIPDLVYVNYEAMPVLSLRNSDLQEDNIEDIKTLKRGTVLPCTVSTTDSLGVYIEAPILRYRKTILVPKESLSADPNVATSDLRLNQFIYAKVINISKNLDHIVASAKLSDVWNFDIQSSVQYFSEYINELLKIREYFKELKNPVACLNLGEIVSGTVRQINEDKSCVLSLENGAKAIVPKEHIKEDISINDKVEGVVLFWNFENNEVEVALCPKLISRINHIQNANINIPAGVTNKSNAHAEVLLKKDDFTLGVLRGAAGKRQLIFFPTKLHPNDFKQSVCEYVVGDYINIQVNKIENGIIIGLLKQLVKDMNFKWKKNLKQKHDLDDKPQEQPPKKRQKIDSINESDDKKINKKKEKNNITENTNKINNSEENKIEIKKTKKERKNSTSEVIVENGNINQKKKKSISSVEDNEEPEIKREKKTSISEENVVEIKKSEKKKKKKTSISTDEDTEINEVFENKNEQKKKKKKNSTLSDQDTETNITDEVSENKNEQKKKKKKNSISTDEDNEANITENIEIETDRKTSITDEVSENKNEQKKKKKKNSISTDEDTEGNITGNIEIEAERKTSNADEVSESINEQKRKNKKKKNSISVDEDTETNITETIKIKKERKTSITDEVSDNKNEQKNKKKKNSISTDGDTEANITGNIEIEAERKTSNADEVSESINEHKRKNKKKKNSILTDEDNEANITGNIEIETERKTSNADEVSESINEQKRKHKKKKNSISIDEDTVTNITETIEIKRERKTSITDEVSENKNEQKKKKKKNSISTDEDTEANITENIEIETERKTSNADEVFENLNEQKRKKKKKKNSISTDGDTEANITGNIEIEAERKTSNADEVSESINEHKRKNKKKKNSILTDEDTEANITGNIEIETERKTSNADEVFENLNEQKRKKKKKKNSISTDGDTEANITGNIEIEAERKTSNADEVSESINEHKRKNKKKKNSILTDEDTEANITGNIEIETERKTSNADEVSENMNEQKRKKKKKKNSISIDEDTETSIIETIKIKKERKTSITDEVSENKKEQKRKKKNSISLDEETLIENKKEKKKRKLSEESVEPQQNSKQKSKKSKQEPISQEVPLLLPGADNFWNIPENGDNNAEESSEDDEPNEKELEKLRKKKKLTPAERAEAARLEEERIRKIELELADAETAPKTPDQFDRLVLANPNSSILWINYMAFHLEATEIEKARAIARKALNTIDFREEQEKLNVWLALLNLENRYGTKESFASVLEEAVKMNDSLSVYLQSLTILSDSGKITEFLELLKTVSKKFKQDFKMWTSAAEACYKCDLKEEARNLMQRSLKSLDEKQHINILVQFAFLESRNNEPERAEALLEKVLASYPRRVDVWTSYVDMLIKGNRIHIARNVLERAIGQKLPARKMKTLFSKYVQFETKFGDEESVKKVRLLATEYVKTALN